ncbi:MAG: ABC transporter substrate-binding protein [Clostridiaceae bacterium]
MKKRTKNLVGVTLLVLLFSTFISCKNVDTPTKGEEKEIVKIQLNEVTRSIFYAPLYAAVTKGYFKEEGLELEITTGQGADKTMQQLLSGSVQIGFSGPEQVIYIYNQGREDYPVVFAQLTQKDGSFLVSRTDEKDFSWESLKGKTVVGGRPGGMPEMALEYVLKNHGIDIKDDLNLITNIAFNATAGAFKGGTGDYVALFEPSASALEKENSGHIVASIGKSAGTLPYTCFYATKSYMKANPEIIEGFARAIYKGQQWVVNSTNEEIAKAIIDFFPGTDEATIIKVIANYKEIDAYSQTPYINDEDMTRLMDIIQSYDSQLIPKRPPITDIVDNSFAEKVLQKEIK